MSKLYTEDKSKRIEIVKPGMIYLCALIEPEGNPHDTIVKCPNCGADEYMVATFDMSEYVNLAQTRFFQGYRCEDCGGEACLTYIEDDGKLT